MRCDHCQEAISVRLDGELDGLEGDRRIDDAAIVLHLERCPACRGFADGAEAMRRVVRLRPAEAVPDLTAPILLAIGEEERSRRTSSGRRWVPKLTRLGVTGSGWLEAAHLRIGLAVLAIAKLLIAIPALVLGSESGAAVHVAREAGSFEVALAFGLLVVAWQPVRAAGLFPLMATLTACLFVTAAVDVVRGREDAVVELTHITELVGLALVWLLGRGDHSLGLARRSSSRYA
jgi:predicted anti-sigma-YlaC factor YlaD